MRGWWRVPARMWVGLALLLGACAPQATSEGPGGGARPPESSAPKVLTVGLQREIGNLGGFGGGGGATQEEDLLHDGLVVNREGVHVPRLAAEQISVEKGTWRINPDGSMDTTWHIRPNVTWHDGTPFTSEDLAFTYTARRDAALPTAASTTLKVMSSVAAVDPLTLAVHWDEVNVRANEAVGLSPLPKHLLEGPYRAGAESFLPHPYFRAEYVGLGPYRLAGWEAGVQMDLARFDAYYLGPAPIDRIMLRYIPDPTAMIANILAGAVEVVVPPGIDLDAAAEVRRRWEGTGNRVVTGGFEDMNSAYTLQFRPDYAQPRAGVPNRDVREALYRAIDRQEMTDAINFGLAPVADSWISPMHGLRRQLEPAIPQYPYDLSKASQLLAGAGWVRGPDGALIQSETGERFAFELAGPVRPALQKQQAIIADGWKAIGVVGEIFVIPSALDLISETRSTRPGAYLGSISSERYYFQDQLHSREITSAVNWSKRNRGGYSNPNVDAVFDRLRATIDERDRVGLYRDIVRTAMGDVALWPFYWDVYPVLALASVKGPIYPSKGNNFRNILEWDKG